MALEGIGINAGSVNTIVGPTFAPQTGRGFLVQLARNPSINLNTVQANTLFTCPASGYNRVIVMWAVLDNFSGTPTTNAVSFGSSNGTSTDWLGITTLAGSAGTGKALVLYPATNVGFAAYTSASGFFQMSVTTGGAAITCDVVTWGFYE